MKKIFTLWVVVIPAIFLAGCIKENTGFDENYWLSKERGVVVYSDDCRYYVVQTAYGYTILRAPGSYQPYEGAIVYGHFSHYGFRDFYNRSSGLVFAAEVVEYRLTYTQAQMAIYYYCPYGKNQIKKPGTDSVATQ